MTNQERFRRIDELFQAVCDLPEVERESRLIELAPMEHAIRSEVLALLLADEDTSLTPEAVQSGIVNLLGAVDEDQPDMAGFTLVGEIGAGGMGVVFEAEQGHPRRRVALKVLRSGLVTAELIRRFEYEADALGRLQHPGIAQVYEAGITSSSRPFFAMEFVEGQPLDAWGRAPGVTRRQKLELFAAVCDAVQHAHSKGVIHRDLKPANILVTTDNEPKVLDFGVSRVSDPAREAKTAVTQAGQLLGTLPYMSPEQLSGRVDEVDTRSDVFALGVVLYELLGAKLPLDVRGMGVVEAARVIEHDQPPALSTLDPRCRGDLETIAGTAMSKDRSRRYSTAAALADDIRRHLAGDTIAARPASAIYQFSRFAKRHRAVVAAGAAVFVTLSIGVAGTSWGFARATRQAEIAEARRVEAERQTRVAEQTVSFLNNDVLAAVVPSAQGKDVTVREALEASAVTIGDRFADEPIVGATIRNNIGNVFHAIGSFSAGERLISEAVEIFERELGPADLRSIEARIDLAKIVGDQGRIEEASERFDALSASVEALLGENSPPALQLLVLRAQLAIGAYGDSDTARTLLDQFQARRTGVLDDDASFVVHAAQVRGDLAFFVSDYAEAELNYRKTHTRHTRELGETHPATLVALHNIAAALEGQGRHAEAQSAYLRVLEIERERSGWDHPDVLVTAHNLAFSYESTGRYEEAEPIYLDTLERCRRVFGPAHPGTLTCTGSLSSLYRETGRLDDAETLIIDALAAARPELGNEAEAIRSLESKLGVMMLENGKPREAEPYLRAGVLWAESVLPEGHPRIASQLLALGTALARQDRWAESIEQTERALVIFEAAGEADDADRASRLIQESRDRVSSESGPS